MRISWSISESVVWASCKVHHQSWTPQPMEMTHLGSFCQEHGIFAPSFGIFSYFFDLIGAQRWHPSVAPRFVPCNGEAVELVACQLLWPYGTGTPPHCPMTSGWMSSSLRQKKHILQEVTFICYILPLFCYDISNSFKMFQGYHGKIESTESLPESATAPDHQPPPGRKFCDATNLRPCMVYMV